MFDPQSARFPYPERTDQHYLKLKKNAGIVFDADYPYINRRFGFRFVSFWVRVLLYAVVVPVAAVRMGLKIEGKQNLNAHRALLKNGAVSCCNHVHMWDYIAIMGALFPIMPHILVWGDNVNGEYGKMMRHVGGIPIPEGSRRATMTYMRQVRDLLQRGGWLHLYPEGSMWEYYRPIRPFKSGAAYFACEQQKPLVPMAYTYRPANWLRRRVFGQLACFTLHIGEPLFADETLDRRERVNDLTKRGHEAVCRLAGIDPNENLYPPLFDDSPRVDYYTSTYGIGYTTSW